MVHDLLADSARALSIGRWKERGILAPEFLLDDREDISANGNSFFYEEKRNFRPDGVTGEQTRRVAEDVDLLQQPRLVTRVCLHTLRQTPFPRMFHENLTRLVAARR